jgi:CRISPR/Cas system CSM-associated protein Csm2 small subunit
MRDILSEILKRIKEAKNDTTEAIASGMNIHSYDSYQRMVGKRDGIQEVLDIIDQILSEDDENN